MSNYDFPPTFSREDYLNELLTNHQRREMLLPSRETNGLNSELRPRRERPDLEEGRCSDAPRLRGWNIDPLASCAKITNVSVLLIGMLRENGAVR